MARLASFLLSLGLVIRPRLVRRVEQERGTMARMLIIDDDAQIRALLRMVLEREGHEVVETPDGHAGLLHYQAAPLDVILLDLLMPEQHGFAIIRALRQVDPAVQIIAMSGCGQTGTVDMLRAAEMLGAQRTLRKPFSLQELLEAVRELTQGEDEGTRIAP
jgi:DNA-binding response OmpR family regulator